MSKSFKSILILCLCISFSLSLYADCPSADLTGDCFVDMEDLALLASQWMTGRGVPADMAFIPGGTFVMGDSFNEGESHERPIHIVTLSPFYIGSYAITNKQYAEFLNSAYSNELIDVDSFWGVYGKENNMTYCHPFNSDSQVVYNDGLFSVQRKMGRCMADDPMVVVTWYGAVAYSNWRSEQEGRQPCYDLVTWESDFTKDGYRLPTEAEWEYAARGGLTAKRFPWGDEINHNYANYRAHGSVFDYDTSPYTIQTYHPTWSGDGITPYTAPVYTFEANGFGLNNMVGNIAHWCNDWYSNTYYQESPPANPMGPETGTSRVIRGASMGGSAYLCRVSTRYPIAPDFYGYGAGFRIVTNIE